MEFKEVNNNSATVAAPRDCSQQLSQANEFHKRAAEIYAEIAKRAALSPFYGSCEKIDKSYEQFDIKKEGHSAKEWCDLFSSVIESANFDHIKVGVSSAGNEIAEMLIKLYEDQLGAIFSGRDFEKFGEKFKLNIDLRTSQIEKIAAIVSSHFTQAISEAGDLAQHRRRLQANYHDFAQAADDKFDWGSAARHFGAGALAFANPLIGIPALIANFAAGSDKNNRENSNIEVYFDLFSEFEDKIISLREKIDEAAERTKDYTRKKYIEVNSSAVSEVLREVFANDYAIDHYFTSLDLNDLREAEEIIFGEEIKSGKFA
ncbi:hypothetical protein [Ralstonia sp. SET104]|uniref:hypothetical protein n=1 Tax=Ralstonia sp. SET104 TaxID=2448774 RepID=UPI000F58C938|nr:hypothetical protein [Ralstonia sp. SET104]GCB02621.1 hypothetical protein PSUB009319_02520 [Ralstonia sp. SET104]